MSSILTLWHKRKRMTKRSDIGRDLKRERGDVGGGRCKDNGIQKSKAELAEEGGIPLVPGLRSRAQS
jgi:hypothetical protein